METSSNIIPLGKFVPYTLSDLSVVIPQASQYVRRIKWFLPQYVRATPIEVIKNTIVVYDPEDQETRSVLADYGSRGIRGVTTTPPHSTYKMEAGFKEVKTRLCVRMHNDCFIARSDWAQILIDRFNSNHSPQLIGALNVSGGIDQITIQKIVDRYPFWRVDNSLPVSPAGFLSAFFMASQSYIMKTVYPIVVDINEGKMDKEDVLFTYLASIYNFDIISWSNMYSYLTLGSKAYGDFDEGEVPPKFEDQILVETTTNQSLVSVFNKAEI